MNLRRKILIAFIAITCFVLLNIGWHVYEKSKISQVYKLLEIIFGLIGIAAAIAVINYLPRNRRKIPIIILSIFVVISIIYLTINWVQKVIPSPTKDSTDSPTAVITPALMTESAITPVLKTEPVLTERVISHEQATAYLDIINELISKYGEGDIVIETDNCYQVKGLGVVRLIDFDNDGTYELYCAYCSKGFTVDTERIYGFRDNNAILIMENRVSNPGTDISPSTTFISKDGKTYIWDQYETCSGSFLTIENNTLVEAMTYYDDFWDGTDYELNGKPCTPEELTAAIDNFIKDSTKDYLSYFYSIEEDSSIIIDTDHTIQLLKDKVN